MPGYCAYSREKEAALWARCTRCTRGACLSLMRFMVLNANWTEGWYDGMPVGRGEIAASLRYVEDQTGLSVSQIRTGLDWMVRLGEIERKGTIKTARNTLLYRVVAYEDWTANNENSQAESQAGRKLVASWSHNQTKNKEEELREEPPPPPARARGHVGDWYNPSHPYGFPRAGDQEDWKAMLVRDAWERDLVEAEPDFNAQALMLTVHRAGKSLVWTLGPDYADRVYHYLHRHPAFLSGPERLHMPDLLKLNTLSLKGGDKGPFIREPLDYFGKTKADDGRYRFQAILLYDEERQPRAVPNGRSAEDTRPRPKDLSATLHASAQRKSR